MRVFIHKGLSEHRAGNITGNKKSRKRAGGFAALAAAVLLTAGTLTCYGSANEPERVAREDVKIGCIIAEEYGFFSEQLSAAAESLSRQGLIGEYDPPEGVRPAQEVWDDICDAQKIENAEFVKESFYNTDQMEESEKEDVFFHESDVDLMLVLGTAAGVWLTENAEELPFEYMVFSSADPISGGIVKSETERFNDISFAHVDPGRLGRQTELAYEIMPFDSIGVVYEDSDAAYSYSGIAQLEALSEEKGFEIHRKHVDEPSKDNNYTRYYNELKAAYHELIPDIDVLYITTGMIEDNMLPWLLEEVHEAGIITVAETSESQVEQGALMHITMTDAPEEGGFLAQTLIDYLDGTPIGELDQVFLITPHISLNLDTIEKVGAKIPMSIYLIADKIYGQGTDTAAGTGNESEKESETEPESEKENKRESENES